MENSIPGEERHQVVVPVEAEFGSKPVPCHCNAVWCLVCDGGNILGRHVQLEEGRQAELVGCQVRKILDKVVVKVGMHIIEAVFKFFP